jgi:hypothetical protein
VAVDSLSRISDQTQARKLLDHGISLTPQQAADARFDLGALTRTPV